jgi:hypothetical protein
MSPAQIDEATKLAAEWKARANRAAVMDLLSVFVVVMAALVPAIRVSLQG